MRLDLIIILQIILPVAIELFKCPDFFDSGLGDKVIHYLMKFFDLSLTLA